METNFISSIKCFESGTGSTPKKWAERVAGLSREGTENEFLGVPLKDEDEVPETYEISASKKGFARVLQDHIALGLTAMKPEPIDSDNVHHVTFDRTLLDDPTNLSALTLMQLWTSDIKYEGQILRYFFPRIISVSPKGHSIVPSVLDTLNPGIYSENSAFFRFLTKKIYKGELPDGKQEFFAYLTSTVVTHEPNIRTGKHIDRMSYDKKNEEARNFCDLMLYHELGHYMVIFLENDEFAEWMNIVHDSMKDIIQGVNGNYSNIPIGLSMVHNLNAAVSDSIQHDSDFMLPSGILRGDYLLFSFAIEEFADAWMCFVNNKLENDRNIQALNRYGYHLTEQKMQFFEEFLQEELIPRDDAGSLFVDVRSDVKRRTSFQMTKLY